MTNFTKPTDINKVWSLIGDNLAPSDSKISSGWGVEIPPRQWFNWIDNKQDQAIAHINQHGVPVWDAVTEYQASSSFVQGSNGKLYFCLQTNTNQNPITDVSEVYWTDIMKPGVAVFASQGVTAWTVPAVLKAGLKKAQVMVIGGGGGGGSNVNAGSGGGGGGIAYKLVDLTGVTSVTVTVGAGGASGVNGGSSSFGAHCSATGGNNGQGGGGGTDLGVGGIGSGGDWNDTLGPGQQRHSSVVIGEKVSGKGGGPGGGSSIESGTIPGNPGVGFGCGGGGGTGGAAGGAGKNGLVVIRW